MIITKFQIFETHAYSKEPIGLDLNDVFIVFDDFEGRKILSSDEFKQDKEEILKIFKKYYDIEDYMEKYIMKDSAWAWHVDFYNSFNKDYLQINIVTTVGWNINNHYNIISAKEFINVGLENLKVYFQGKKYNL